MKYILISILCIGIQFSNAQNYLGVKLSNSVFYSNKNINQVSLLPYSSFAFEKDMKNSVLLIELQYLSGFDSFRAPMYCLVKFPIINKVGNFRMGAGVIPSYGDSFSFLLSGDLSLSMNIIENRGVCQLGIRNSRGLGKMNDIFYSTSLYAGLLVNLDTIIKRKKNN